MFISYLFEDPKFYIFWIVIIVFSICVHEFSHALVAYWQGDDTAKNQGFFTINPMVQMGKVPLMCLLFFGLSWGACPVTPSKFNHRYSDALVSFAGPFSNFVLSAVFTVFGCALGKYANTSVLMNNVLDFCYVGAYSNAVMAIFNLIPLPPLDGSKIFEYIVPQSSALYSKMGSNGFVFLFLILTIFPQLSSILWGSGISFIKSISALYYSVAGLF